MTKSKISNEFDRVYIIKYLDELGIQEISKSFQTSSKIIEEVIEEIKVLGLYKYYKDMPENEWENLSGRTKRRQQELINEGYKRYSKQLFKNLVNEFKEEYPMFEKYYNPTHMPEIKTTGEDEEWKKIGELNYEISNYGRIRNTKTKKLKKLKFNKYGVQVLL